MRAKTQFLSARVLSRVVRGGWGPVPFDSSRLIRVIYPSKETP